ncbi:MAG: hypothetical protein MK130_06875, partial [Puniceicoccaceae bacterium]|nr:hypothetical protein [Puniceicoccaceae bacterium]
RLGEKDQIRYPQEYQIKRISGSGHLSYCGANFYLSEIYAGCRVGVFENSDGITELHYANLHLGNLEFNGKDAWRPKTLIIPPQQKPRSARPK